MRSSGGLEVDECQKEAKKGPGESALTIIEKHATTVIFQGESTLIDTDIACYLKLNQ